MFSGIELVLCNSPAFAFCSAGHQSKKHISKLLYTMETLVQHKKICQRHYILVRYPSKLQRKSLLHVFIQYMSSTVGILSTVHAWDLQMSETVQM